MKREPVAEYELRAIHSAIGRISYADYVYVHCCLGISTREFIALKKSDVRMEGGSLILTGGSGADAGRERSIPVPAEVFEIISLRLEQPGTDLLFPRANISRGVWLGWKPMTYYWYSRNILKPLMAELE